MSDENEELSDFHRGQILTECLILIREDICDWINEIFGVNVIDKTRFLSDLNSGIILCDLVCKIETLILENDALPIWWNKNIPKADIKAKDGSFKARDNISKFLAWCRSIGMKNTILFETKGLINQDEEKNVVLTLLNLAESLSTIKGIPLPEFAQFYRQFVNVTTSHEVQTEKGRETRINSSVGCNEDSDSGINSPRSSTSVSTTKSLKPNQSKPLRPNSSNDPTLKSMSRSMYESGDVTDGLRRGSRCFRQQRRPSTAHSNAPLLRSSSMSNITYIEHKMTEISRRCCCDPELIIEKSTMQEGMYRIGKTSRFVRVFRGTIVLRVGGGWETFAEYIKKLYPCTGPHASSEVKDQGQSEVKVQGQSGVKVQGQSGVKTRGKPEAKGRNQSEIKGQVQTGNKVQVGSKGQSEVKTRQFIKNTAPTNKRRSSEVKGEYHMRSLQQQMKKNSLSSEYLVSVKRQV